MYIVWKWPSKHCFLFGFFFSFETFLADRKTSKTNEEDEALIYAYVTWQCPWLLLAVDHPIAFSASNLSFRLIDLQGQAPRWICTANFSRFSCCCCRCRYFCLHEMTNNDNNSRLQKALLAFLYRHCNQLFVSTGHLL